MIRLILNRFKVKNMGLRFADLFGDALFPEEEVKQRRLTELNEE